MYTYLYNAHIEQRLSRAAGEQNWRTVYWW